MPEQHPTNARLAELLEEIASEVRELKEGQNRLAANVEALATLDKR